MIPTSLEHIRSFFPHIQTGRIYCNHAATGPLSTRVIEAMQRHLFDRSAGLLDTFDADMTMVGELRSRVAALINAPSPDRIAFPPNTSEGIAIVASGLPWQSGDRILLNSAEFPANVYPYIALRQAGVELDFVQCERGAVTPEMIESSLTPRTRLVALSAVQFLSGYRADLAAIGDLCRRRNIIFAVDGIQAVGAVRVDVQAMKIDALAAGAQKWQLSPHGAGFLYLTEELQSRITQSHLGWLSVDDPWQFYAYDQPLAASARRYEPGSLSFPALWGMHASLGLLLEVGLPAVEESCPRQFGPAHCRAPRHRRSRDPHAARSCPARRDRHNRCHLGHRPTPRLRGPERGWRPRVAEGRPHPVFPAFLQ